MFCFPISGSSASADIFTVFNFNDIALENILYEQTVSIRLKLIVMCKYNL